MKNILKNYRQSIDKNEVDAHIKKISETAQLDYNVVTLKKIFNLIDLTSLNSTDSKRHIISICEKVNNFQNHYPEMPNVAAICVYPNFAKTVKENLKVQGIQIATVTGGFPSSQTFIEIKEKETELAVKNGADETDMVISIGEFLEGDYELIFNEIKALKNVMGAKHLKVIFETGALVDYYKIYVASILAMEAGADFIKTSTGKMQPAATIEAIYVMCLAIKDYYEKHNLKVGLKPAGGISNGEQAVLFYSVVKNILGEAWLNNKLFRVGASSLANTLLTEIINYNNKSSEKVVYF